ncbi:MAG TPA: hypothetical protein VGF59_25915 [Bryobacteraceae bacterium]|jgi:hypothetical protein
MLKKIAIVGLLATAAAFAQLNSIVQTSLSAAITSSQTSFNVASATGINAPTTTVPGSVLYVVDPGQKQGEAMPVVAVSSTTITVRRTNGRAVAHASGSMVLVATSPNWFYSVDPQGTCTAASVYVSPYINITNGNQWLCSSKTGTWTAGWGNNIGTPAVLSATATASVAGATAIAGPIVEISGTNAITAFTMSTGWNGQGFCVNPTAAFTTTATSNIAKASTGVASKALCYTYDAQLAAFAPSY